MVYYRRALVCVTIPFTLADLTVLARKYGQKKYTKLRSIAGLYIIFYMASPSPGYFHPDKDSGHDILDRRPQCLCGGAAGEYQQTLDVDDQDSPPVDRRSPQIARNLELSRALLRLSK